MRGVDFAVFKLITKVVGVETVSAIMTAMRTVMAISEAVTVFDVMACLSAPVAHLAVVFAPCMNSPIANGGLGPTTSFAFEIGGLVHIAVNAMADTSYGISGGKTVQTLIYG